MHRRPSPPAPPRARPALALAALAAALACRTSAPPPAQGPASAGAASPDGRAGATEAALARAAAAPSTPGIDPAVLDPSVRPCDDFYRYACGGWLARTPIPPEKPRWARGFSEVEERNVARLREIAEADAAGRLDPGDRYPAEVGALYAACMDEKGAEARGLAALRELWARIDAVGDPRSLSVEVGRLHRVGLFQIFHLASDQDARDATQVIGAVVQGGLSLPDRDYYFREDAKTAAIQAALRAHVARMLALAGVPEAEAARQADAVYALERALAEAHWTRVELRDPKRVYNRVDLAGLEKLAPRFDWRAYLEAVGHPGLTAFSTTTPRYLSRVNELLAATPAATWQAYLRWRVLSHLAAVRALPRRFVDERFAFARNFTGAEQQEPRWKDCLGAVTAGMPEALGQAFVRRHFGEEAKARTKELVADVEAAMGRDLDGLAWMDGPTRARAKEKLSRVVNKVGYPDRWRSYDGLVLDRASWARSHLATMAFEVNRDLSKIGKPVDRGEWRAAPSIVNAFYGSGMNAMVFPAGILQPPFYTRGAPDAVNYGAVGVVVGHELTHGFDDRGRQYDGAGNLVDWWSPGVGAEFDRRAACVVRQFDGYVAVEDQKLNGRLTLGENIADLGGLKLAFAAYGASRARAGAEAPVAGFTPEQAFFVGFAQSWCTSVRPAFARARALTDPHSPPEWRVNGPLSNLPEFAAAFSCPAGSRMVRPAAERCEVW